MFRRLLVKAAFVRDGEEVQYDLKTGVRTDFITRSIYSYLLSQRYHVQCIRPMNGKEEEVLEKLKAIVNTFRNEYATTVRRLCTEIDLTVETVGITFQGVSNELFSDGITWSRIVAFLVFAGEITLLCLSRGKSPIIVDVVYECLSSLVKEKLEYWIFDHGGWAGSIVALGSY